MTIEARAKFIAEIVFAAVIAIILFGGIWFYVVQESYLKRMVEDDLSNICRLKMEGITAWRGERLGDGAVLRESPGVNRDLPGALAHHPQAIRNIHARFRSLAAHYGYDNIYLVNSSGGILINLNGWKAESPESLSSEMAPAFESGKPVLSDLTASALDPKPHNSVIVPFTIGAGMRAAQKCAVIMVYPAEKFLYSLIQTWPVHSRSAETFLVRKDGDSVLYLSPLRFNKDAALKLRIPFAQDEEPAVKAVKGYEGIVQGPDYRGVEVLSAVKAVPETPWKVIAKVDASEAFSAWRAMALFIIILILLLVLISGVVFYIAWQRITREYKQTLSRTQDALSESVDQFQIAFMNMVTGMSMVDLSGRWTLVSPGLCVITGYSETELLKMNFFDLSLPEGLETVLSKFRKLASGEIDFFRMENRYRHKDGHVLWIELTVTPILAANGKPKYYISQILNINERKMIDEILRSTEEKYRQVVENVMEGISVIQDGQIKFVNTFAAHSMGYEPEGMKDLPFEKIIHPDDRAQVAENHRRRLAGGKFESNYQFRIVTLLGQIRWVEINAVKIEWEGRPATLNFTSDVTEKRKALASQSENERRYRALFDSALDAIFISDQVSQMVLDANPAACLLYGYTRGEFLRKKMAEVSAEPAKTIRAITDNTVLVSDRLHRKKDGTIFPVEVSSTIINLGGRLLRIGIIRDITSRRKAEEDLRDSEEKHRILFETSTDALMTLEPPDWRFSLGNPACLRLFLAKDAAEFESKGPWDLSPEFQPDGQPSDEKAGAMIEKAVREGSHFFEWTHRRLDGESFPATVLLTRFERGGKLLLQATVRDITFQKKAETYREMGREIIQIMNQPGDLREVLQRVAAHLRERTGFDAVGIRLREGQDFPYAAHLGFSKNFLLTENSLTRAGKDGLACRDQDGNVLLECTCGLVLRGKADPSNPLFTKGGSFWTNESRPLLNIPPEEELRLYPRNKCVHLGYDSLALVPIRDKEKIIGLAQFNDPRSGCFSLEIVEMLEGIASILGEAITRIRAEEELRFQNLLLSTEHEASLDGILVVGEKGKILSFNKKFIQMWRIPSSVIATKSDEKNLEYVIGQLAEPESFMLKVQYLYQHRYETSFDEVALKDGRVFDRYSSPMIGPDGIYRGRIWYFRDMTEQKKAQQTRERLNLILKSAPEAITGSDLQGVFTDWNKGAEILYGYKASEVLGKPVLLLAPEGMEKQFLGLREKTLNGETVLNHETKRRRKDGSLVEVSQTLFPMRDNQNRIIGVTAVARDITELKNAENVLKESEIRFRTLIEKAPIAMSLSRDGVSLYGNQKLREIVGLNSPKETVGTKIGEYFAPEYREASQERTKRRVKSLPVPEEFESVFLRGDGSSFPVRISVKEVQLPDGPAHMAFITDLTEQKQSEKLLVAKGASDAANQAKSVFLASMSHEIRTPMNAILGFAQLLARDPDLTARQARQLDNIDRAGNHLLSLINDVLEMSKIEAGRITLHPNHFGLDAFLGDLEVMFRLRAAERGLDFMIEKSGDLPKYVCADEAKLRQALINLLGNSLKFTEKGSVRLRARSERSKSNDLRLVMEVSDTGPGISREEMECLFDPFEQGKAGQLAGTGTGLGLTISRRLARLMGGDLTAESQIGKGSTFRLEVQVEEGSPEKVASPLEGRKVRALAQGQPHYRVLVVDDREDNRAVLSGILSPLGFEIQEASDGRETIEKNLEWNPQLILLDMNMPVMDGYAALRLLREKGSAVPVIGISASAFEENRRAVLAAGADDFIGKPLREEDLLEKIKYVLGAQYEYGEKSPLLSPSAPPLDEKALSSALAELPRKWLEQLAEAASKARLDRLILLIGQVEQQSPEAARQLRQLADGFRYADLIRLLPKGVLKS